MLDYSVCSFIIFWSITFAASLPQFLHLSTNENNFEARADRDCNNTAATRSCWGNGYSISTNYDATWPRAGKVRTYHLRIQNLTLAPDGISRPVYGINGQYPGPTIRADWGDILEVKVTNELTTNGTAIHWHGIRQYLTNGMDGTGGITECPLAPGQSRTYRFNCTQFGTSWYHSHYSDQYSDGVVGSIIIDGPTTSNYDIDLGAYPITDWYHTPVFTTLPLLEAGRIFGPPKGDNVLINSTNVFGSGSTTGRYARTTLSQGKKYKLRILNTSTNDNFQVFLDGHKFTVVTADFVPIMPYVTTYLFIGIGQRYDVIINANQPNASYYFHAIPQVGKGPGTGCAANNNTNALSIFTYEGADSTSPPANTIKNTAPETICVDDIKKFVPFVRLNVPDDYKFTPSSDLTVGFAITGLGTNKSQVQWNLNNDPIKVAWDNPTLSYAKGNEPFPKEARIITLPKANQWSYWVIQAIGTIAPAQAHPIHLHGHDFYVLGSGTGNFTVSSSPLLYKNPPRRDVAMLPGGGWLVVAFITDNPGAWLMHCHLSFHISLGLGVQFLERATELGAFVTDDFNTQCRYWKKYYRTAQYKQIGSGL